MIGEYTRKFYRSLVHIEQSDKMKQFYGEDNRQRQRHETIKEKYNEICEVIQCIDKLPPNLKANAVRTNEEKIDRLNSEVIQLDKQMKRTNLLLQQAMTRTVDLEPLSSRVFSKYLKFIDEKVKQCMKQPL